MTLLSPRSTRRRALLLALAVPALGLPAASLLPSASASTPTESTLTAPTTYGASTTAEWTGIIPPGANPTSSCAVDGTDDQHAVNVLVPAGLPKGAVVSVQFKIVWEPVDPSDNASDEILTVLNPDGSILASSDGGAPEEVVVGDSLAAGSYVAVACGFANGFAQPYTGTATISIKPPPVVIPSAPAQGLEFSATAPSDPQRNQGEPAITVDPAGTVYSCGPSGFSNIAEYAQVSEDGGETFHLLGSAPRGQISSGEGGGDCALAASPVKNAEGNYTVAYAGLGPLTNFSTFTSPDNGKTLTGSAISESAPGVDRQWIAFTDANTAFFNYNSLSLGGSVVQKSTDGGLTYEPIGQVAATDGGRLGQIRAFVPPGKTAAEALVYYPYLAGASIKFALSQDGGETFSQCLAAVSDADPSAGFPVADHDEAGNVYLTYAEKGGGRDTYLTAISFEDFKDCKGESTDSADNNTNPGFRTPIRINVEGVETTVMPWVAAGGLPGRVAVAFYGTKSMGDPDSGMFDASWNVYVSQTLDMFSAAPKVAQVQATTHPFHYDSICLNGLACDTSVPAGDRSLVDYFTMEYNKGTGRLTLVYSQPGKLPDDAEGQVATPAVIIQRAGPSNGGGDVATGRPVIRTSSPDPEGDAITNYSRLNGAGLPAAVEDTLDLVGTDAVTVGPERSLEDGSLVPDGGLTFTLKVANLSETDLTQTLAANQSGEALFLVRFVNGFRAGGVSARYTPGAGWRFGFDGYNATQTAGARLLTFPGATGVDGRVDPDGGTIELNVPRDLLNRLVPASGVTTAAMKGEVLDLAAGERPVEQKAVPGSRLYDVTAYSLLNPLPSAGVPQIQSYLYPVDQAPAMDVLLPGQLAAPVPPSVGPGAVPGTGGTGGSGGAPGSAGGGGLAATGLPFALPVLGLVLLGGAAYARRRRQDR